MSSQYSSRRARRVAVVTGGGGGIGTAVALALARNGVAVVAMDPGTGVQGEPLGEPTAAETARRIESEGGTAVASTVSVTDRAALRSLFDEVVSDFGALDIVVNTAGILRFSAFPDTPEDDWRAVVDVHLRGYLNVLETALPLMAATGYGRIVGVTSGVGLARTAGASLAYGCAKRAVAALTWQLGNLLPDGVTVNALSPIAATRMVRRSLGGLDDGPSPAGLDLSAMPQADDMGPAAAYLAAAESGWCRGRVIFSAGPELSLIAPPRLIEAVRTEGASSFAAALGTIVPVVLGPAEAGQHTTGGSNPRLGAVFDHPATPPTTMQETGASGADPPACVIVSDCTPLASAVAEAVSGCGMVPVGIGAWRPFDRSVSALPVGFAAASETLDRIGEAAGNVAAVIVALGGPASASGAGSSWQQVLASHGATIEYLLGHAGWLHATARYAERRARPVRIVHLTDAAWAGGRTAAQAIAQMARSVNDLPSADMIDVFSVALESIQQADYRPVARLVARMTSTDDGRTLRGAELFARAGWMGIRSHPSPAASVSFGQAAIPGWVSDALRETI